MTLRAIHTGLIVIAILLMTIIRIILSLSLCSTIANIFGVHALNRASFSRLTMRRNIFIAIGGARADAQYCKARRKKSLKIHADKSLLKLLIFYMFRALIVLLLYISVSVSAMERPEGIVYCHEKVVIEYRLINPDKNGTASDVDLTVNGKTSRYMTAYSWFGSNQVAPKGFKFAILGEKQFDPLLVFDIYLEDTKKQKYFKCN